MEGFAKAIVVLAGAVLTVGAATLSGWKFARRTLPIGFYSGLGAIAGAAVGIATVALWFAGNPG